MPVLCSAQYWVHGKRRVGRPKGETSNIVLRPKKKRGRKRLFTSTKGETECKAVAVGANDMEMHPLPHGLAPVPAGGKC
jgi:hypothetical protein